MTTPKGDVIYTNNFVGNRFVGEFKAANFVMKKLKQAHGNWVEGDQFWDRVEDLALLTERIKDGANILLVAQRRMGKTSLMRELKRRLVEENENICIFVDLEKAFDAADAIVELSVATREFDPVWKKTTNVFSNTIKTFGSRIEKVSVGELGVTLRAGMTAADWSIKGDQLMEVLAGFEKPVLLLMDEVPILINRLLKGTDGKLTHEGRDKADSFMSWLRESCQKYQRSVQILLAGSIGLEPILRQANLSATLNSFSAFELKPWSDEVAEKCLTALAVEYEVKLNEGVTREIMRHLGCNIPHHVQMFFDRIYTQCKRRGNMVFKKEEVKPIYEREMLSTHGHAELMHYEERLKTVLGDEAFTFAVEMLTEAAIAGRLERETMIELRRYQELPERDIEEVQGEILWVLEHDGYLQPTADGYKFVSNLVRDWWKRRHALLYTPVAEREG